MSNIDPSTQIGPDGRRHPIADVPSIGKVSPGGEIVLAPMEARTGSGSSTPVEVRDHTEVRLDLVVSALGGVNEVQTVTLANATGGTFTLTLDGQTTAGIAYNAAASAVQSALEALSTVGAGNVAVTGTGPYTVTFQGALGNRDVSQMTASAAGLTSGTTATVTVATQTGGASSSVTVTVETSATADGTFTSVGAFNEAGTVSTQHQDFDDLDDFVRVSYTVVGTSATFEVAGKAV